MMLKLILVYLLNKFDSYHMIYTVAICPGPSRTRYVLFCDGNDSVCIERNQFCDGVRDCDTTDNDEVNHICEIGRYCLSVHYASHM